MELVTDTQAGFRHCEVKKKGSDMETEPDGRRQISTCGIRCTEWEVVTGFTETKKTNIKDKTNNFSRRYRTIDQKWLRWGHLGRDVCSWWVQQSPTPDLGQGPRFAILLMWRHGLNLPHPHGRTVSSFLLAKWVPELLLPLPLVHSVRVS